MIIIFIFEQASNGETILVSGCSPEPVKVTVLANVAGMNGDQRNQSEYIVNEITASLHIGSSVYIGELSYTAKEVISFKTSSEVKQIHFTKDTGSNSYSIYANTIDRELMKTFSFGQYRIEAEFVVLLVSDKTELDNVSSLLKKKKTFVIVFGSSIPAILKTAASRKDYLFQVESYKDIENVANKIKKQIACGKSFSF